MFATMLRRVVLLALVWALVASSVGFAAGYARTPTRMPAHPGRHPRLVSITLSPDSAALVPGEKLRFAATGALLRRLHQGRDVVGEMAVL